MDALGWTHCRCNASFLMIAVVKECLVLQLDIELRSQRVVKAWLAEEFGVGRKGGCRVDGDQVEGQVERKRERTKEVI